MRKIILVVLALVLTLATFLTLASPALACAAGKTPGYWKNHPEACRLPAFIALSANKQRWKRHSENGALPEYARS